jgi:Ni/Co efflux regulator RcnB
MNRYLISAAALALLAAPAFAQPDDHHGGGHPGGEGGHPEHAAPAAPAAPAARPAGGGAMRGPGPGGAMRGPGPGGDHHDMRAAPAAAPAAQAPRDTRQDFNRGNNNARPDSNNRPGVGRPDNNRPGAGRPANAPRPNFSSFHDYHRTFSAPRRFHAPAYQRPSGWSYRRWTFGDILPSLYWSQRYWLSDYDSYDLPPPPPGTTWVRYGDDALLIDRYSGEIVTVEYGVFY